MNVVQIPALHIVVAAHEEAKLIDILAAYVLDSCLIIGLQLIQLRQLLVFADTVEEPIEYFGEAFDPA